MILVLFIDQEHYVVILVNFSSNLSRHTVFLIVIVERKLDAELCAISASSYNVETAYGGREAS